MTSDSAPKICDWAGTDPLYVHYHDTEWGQPKADENYLFEKLILEGFQAGLSWITILRKRDNFRKAFRNFDAERIARFTKRDHERLMNNAGIIRNRLKIEATVDNAKAYLKLRGEQSLGHLFWSFQDGKPVQNRIKSMSDIAATTPTSTAISKELKRRGFRFVGPTTVYAMMQSIGMVNDHLVRCPGHARCAKLAKSFKAPKT